MPIGQGIGQPPLILPGDPQGENALNQYLRELNRIARNITFADQDGAIAHDSRPLNINGIWIEYTSNAVADTEDAVTHALGRVPAGSWVGLPDKNAVIYQGDTAWTSDTVYFKSTVATTTVFILLY